VFDLATVPSVPGSVVMAGIGAEAPWMLSEDAGSTWLRPEGIPDTGSASVLAYDPGARVLYAGGSGLYRSADGGRTWNTLDTGLFCCGDTPGHFGSVTAIAADPSNSNRLLVGTGSASKYQPEAFSGVFRTEDGGRTWARSVDGIDPTSVPGINSLLFDSIRPGHVLAGTFAGLYLSDDGGRTWRVQGLAGFRLSAIRRDPHDGTLLAAGPDGKPVHSSDDGVTWDVSSSGLGNVQTLDFAFDPASASVYAATYPSGISRSLDHGHTWSDFSQGLPELSIVAVAIDRAGTLYAGGENLGVFARTLATDRSVVDPHRPQPHPRAIVPRGGERIETKRFAQTFL